MGVICSRSVLLYNAALQSSDNPETQAKLFKRVIDQYPQATFARLAALELKMIESIGKPFKLEFTNTISGLGSIHQGAEREGRGDRLLGRGESPVRGWDACVERDLCEL